MHTSVKRSRGVYFIGNDAMLEMCIPFLNSFRSHNPAVPLCMIPFDRSCAKILSLRRKYNFSVFDRSGILTKIDKISELFTGKNDGVYRKLAMWDGEFETFLYFDADSVVLENCDFGFDLLSTYDFIASQSHIPEKAKYVWKRGILKSGLLSKDQISYAASTGFLASKRNIPMLKRLESQMPQALRLAPYMTRKEQSLLNFLVVTSEARFSSLAMIAAFNPDLDIPLEKWGGTSLGPCRNGRIVKPKLNRTLFVHWAGLWQKGWHKTDPLWKYYRNLSPT